MGSAITFFKKNKWVLFLLFILVLVIVSQRERKPAEPDYVDIMFDNKGGDVPNVNEGTLIMFTKIDMSSIFINPSQRLRYVVLFSSKVVDGFGIKYNFIDSTLEAGLPLIKAETINLLDGNMHQIGYTFKKDVGQELYLDGIKVASGMFTGEKIGGVTGFAVMEFMEPILVGQEINARYVGRQLSEGELREIFNKQR
ncbi:MAG: hypothetical protein KKC75_04365 [Nanoarchaeota archaeon]|nr:hypothetical protein [Nanoarchaeota archaeon]MBU1004581.1 hypothetical protein [Nanoarchaeota archaeon]MBU1946993.1 hypothetical protein [Nanoarchaeota archaeon]